MTDLVIEPVRIVATKPCDGRSMVWLSLAIMLVITLFPAGAAVAAGEDAGNRQLLVVSSGYWKRTYKKYTFDVFDLSDGARRIHREGPAKVGEIRGMAFAVATQRLYVAGHQGLLCYSWPDLKRVWRKPVVGDKKEQNDAISVTLDGKRVYTVRHFSRGMNVYDAATGERLRVIHEDTMPMWGRFSQVSHDGKRLYASNGKIFIIDPATDAIVSSFKPLSEPVRFALTPDGTRFVYATGRRRSLAIHAAADGTLLHQLAVPDWEGMEKAVGKKKRPASLTWMALSPDGRQAWACDHVNRCLHRFDLAAEPPAYAGRYPMAKEAPGHKDDQGLMFSVDGTRLITGSGRMLNPVDGAVLGQLIDERGKPCKASNSMLALEVDAAGGRVLRTNQQCAPSWPAATVGKR